MGDRDVYGAFCEWLRENGCRCEWRGNTECVDVRWNDLMFLIQFSGLAGGSVDMFEVWFRSGYVLVSFSLSDPMVFEKVLAHFKFLHNGGNW